MRTHALTGLTLAAALVFLNGCREPVAPPPPGPDPAVEAEEARRGIDELRDEFVAAFNAGDAMRLAEFYTTDAVVSLPNAPPIEGRDAIRQDFERTIEQFETEFSVSTDELHATRDWAVEFGRGVQRLTPRNGGEEMELHSSHAVLLRMEDGVWRIARLVSSSDQEPRPPGMTD